MASVLSGDTLRGRQAPPPLRWDEVPLGEPLPPGATLADGRYRVDGVLGRGGFGITYAATDTRLERPVAVKELFPDGARRDGSAIVVADGAAAFARARERFRREATTLARFGHPNIVRIFAVLEENDTAYLVLERLEGRTLAAELRARSGPLTEAEALEVAEQAADALAAVHLAGVLHRDVSPANLVRTPDGRVVLIDFGLARPFAEDRTTMMTRIVTPGYAPPEQHAGAGRFSARADVYALGATLYRLLSGRTPADAAARADGADLAPLWRINPTVSRRTSDAVAAALSIDPTDRPATAAVLLDRLGIAVEGLGTPDLVDLRDDPSRPLAPPAPPPAEASSPAAERPTEYRPDVDAIGRSPRGGSDEGRREGEARVDDGPTSWRPAGAVGAVGAEPATEALPGARPALAVAGPTGGAWVVPAPAPDDAGRAVRSRRERPAPLSPEQRLDLASGPPPIGRRWVTLPLGLAAVALASAQPASLVVVLGLGIAPVLATVGDHVLQPERNPAWWPLWWARNVAVGLVRSLGALVVLAVGLCLWFGTDAFDGLRAAGAPVLRATGLVAAGVLALSIARGGPGFRTHVALDAATRRLLPRGRPTLPSLVLLLVCLGVAAAGLAFQPEAWPLR